MRLLFFFLILLIAPACAQNSFAQKPFNVRSDILPAEFQLARDVSYAQIGARKLVFHLLRPKNLPNSPLPVVLFVHGGAWRTGSPDKIPPIVFALARREFAVVAMEFRLAGEAKFPAPLDDLRALVRFLKFNARSYSLDSKKFGAYGVSTGGQLAALLAFSGSSVQAVALESAPSDLATLNSGSRLDWNGPKSPLALFLGANFKQNANLMRRASPIFLADEFAPPTLILHGSADDFIAASQSEKLYQTLRKAGAEVRYFLFDGENHGLSGARSEADARVVEFLVEKLKTRAKS